MFMPPKYYRLLTPLNKLDPTDPRKVENWLIKLRAVADCKSAFLPPVSRADFRMHFNLVGHGFWESLDGWTEVEFFDDLYVRYMRLYASNNAALASYIIGNVDWEKHALLARLIRGTPGTPGWSSTDDGYSMFQWLVTYGSTSDDASQELLITEFAVVMCESRLTKQGLARTQIIFKQAQFAEEVIARLTEIMDIYERVPDQRACPARTFVKVMVTLLAEDVPLLRDWASRLAIDIQTGKVQAVRRSPQRLRRAHTVSRPPPHHGS